MSDIIIRLSTDNISLNSDIYGERLEFIASYMDNHLLRRIRPCDLDNASLANIREVAFKHTAQEFHERLYLKDVGSLYLRDMYKMHGLDNYQWIINEMEELYQLFLKIKRKRK